ncbi:MAG TPA: class II glutamine amidotransferase [Polyangiaceae bacterium]|nr:class II glutamine amidotransferase [Polyangiaceae bacterium]
MARLFGIIGNRPDLAARVLAFEADALRARSSGAPFGWGLGFYQGGEVLMRRRPIDERRELDVARLAFDVRADLVIGHVRHATVGALRTENTHPFRYRQWLFAQTGTVSEFERVRERLVASVPDFLRGDIRGDTDAEVVFHVFLSFLHDGGLLNNGPIDAGLIREALRSSLAVIDGMTAEVGAAPCKLNILVANGNAIVAVNRSDAQMRLRTFSGKGDAELVIGDDPQLRRKVPELSRFHFSIAASDFDEAVPSGRWRPAPECALVTMSRDDEPRIEAL